MRTNVENECGKEERMEGRRVGFRRPLIHVLYVWIVIYALPAKIGVCVAKTISRRWCIIIDDSAVTGNKVSFSEYRAERFPDIPRYYGRQFIRWARNAELARYGYTGVDAFGAVEHHQGNLSYRWSQDRLRRNLALIYSFSESLPAGWDIWFLTLTVRHPACHTYTGQVRAIEDLRAAWDLMRRLALRRIDCRYLRVYEAGEKNGYAHIHMVLVASQSEAMRVRALPERWVAACHKIGNDAVLDAQNLQLCENVRNVGAYLSKYLSKTLQVATAGSEDVMLWRWIEVCYRLRLRCVAMDAVSRRYIESKYAAANCRLQGVAGAWMLLDPSGVDPEPPDIDLRRYEAGCYWADLGIDEYDLMLAGWDPLPPTRNAGGDIG